MRMGGRVSTPSWFAGRASRSGRTVARPNSPTTTAAQPFDIRPDLPSRLSELAAGWVKRVAIIDFVVYCAGDGQ
jgi:hypothetical protein